MYTVARLEFLKITFTSFIRLWSHGSLPFSCYKFNRTKEFRSFSSNSSSFCSIIATQRIVSSQATSKFLPTRTGSRCFVINYLCFLLRARYWAYTRKLFGLERFCFKIVSGCTRNRILWVKATRVQYILKWKLYSTGLPWRILAAICPRLNSLQYTWCLVHWVVGICKRLVNTVHINLDIAVFSKTMELQIPVQVSLLLRLWVWQILFKPFCLLLLSLVVTGNFTCRD